MTFGKAQTIRKHAITRWTVILGELFTSSIKWSMLTHSQRAIACYVNNTISFVWNKSTVSCCSPFFKTSTVKEQHDNYENDPVRQEDLRYLQTSGSYLLHEMMHTLEITGTHGERPHSK